MGEYDLLAIGLQHGHTAYWSLLPWLLTPVCDFIARFLLRFPAHVNWDSSSALLCNSVSFCAVTIHSYSS